MRERRLQNKSFRELIDPERSEAGSFEKQIDANNEFVFGERRKTNISDVISHSHSLGKSEEQDKFQESPSTFDFLTHRLKNKEKEKKKGGL